MKKSISNFLMAFGFVAVLIVSACKDTTTAEALDNVIIPATNVSFAKYIQPVLTIKCANAGCHDDQTAAGSLSLTTWANTTADYQVVAPGYPQNSKLVWRIEGTSGNLMPPIGYAPLTKNQIDGIKTWIKEGAKNN
ncbi:MAG: c-type cytochrome domain-containing protein [Bacteroidota bacterium]